MNIPNINELLAAVQVCSTPISRSFGEIVLYDTKADNTPVTPIDISVHNLLMTWSSQYKDLGFISEEGNGTDIDKPYLLYVDPLDGTGVFMRGIATCTVLATIMKMSNQQTVGTPIMAVIYNPITNESWIADMDDGAYKIIGNVYLGKLQVHSAPNQIRTAVCAWPKASHNMVYISDRIRFDNRFRDQPMGALGISGGLIAQGTLDATAYGISSAVETAAMSLLVYEAGGITIDLNGNPITNFTLGKWKGKTDFLLSNGAIVASNQNNAETLLSFIQNHQNYNDLRNK